MSVTWLLKAYDDEENPIGGKSYIIAKNNREMINGLISNGFHRIWKDDVPLQIPPYTEIVGEHMWFDKDGLHLSAEHFVPIGVDISQLPNGDDLIKRVKKLKNIDSPVDTDR